MPFRRSRSRSRSSSMPKGRKVWGTITTVDVDGLPSPIRLDPGEFSSSWLLSPADAQEFYDEPTLMRLLFNFQANVTVESANVASEFGASIWANFWVTDGVDPALTTAPAFKNPLDGTQQWVWSYQNFLYHRLNNFVISPFVSLGLAQKTGYMDVKTRRKIPEGSGLAAQVWNNDVIGPDFDSISIDFFVAGRALFNDH